VPTEFLLQLLLPITCGSDLEMADLPGYLHACLNTGKLASLAILVSGGIVLQILVWIAFYVLVLLVHK